MRKSHLYFIGIILITIASCSGGIDIAKLKQSGQLAYENKQYDSALNIWERIIHYNLKKNKATGGLIYTEAGKSAIASGQTDKGIRYLEKAENSGYSSPDLFATQVVVYKKIDNLSKEIMALEAYCKSYPEGAEINEIKTRLFETYVESENWQLALDLWPDVAQLSNENPKLMEGYFIVNQELDNDVICDDLAAKLLDNDAENILALEYLAKKYYWKAEDLYKTEHKKYYDNQTRKQYAKLVKALEEVTADFKIALNYFKRLYKIEPKPEYAKYIGNIYGRFDDDEKARYYHNKSKQ